MLMRRFTTLVVCLTPLAGLAACGGTGQDTVSSTQAVPSVGAANSKDASAVCQSFADDPANKGYGIVEVTAARRTTVGALDAWLRDKNGANRPSGLGRHRSLATSPPSDKLTYCLFKSDNLAVPFPPPPPGSNEPPQKADGFELYVTDQGGVITGGMGHLDQMAQPVNSLPTAAP